MSGLPVDLPQFIKVEDFNNLMPYLELQSLILSGWFNSNGFSNAILNNAQVGALLAMPGALPIGKEWYNPDVDAKQFIGIYGVQTITSTY